MFTAEQVRELVAAKRGKLAICFRAEELNSEKLSEYVFQFDIPSTGSSATVTLVSESIPDQRVLKECIGDVLKSVKFPAFEQPSKLVTEVPIRAGGT